MRTLLIIAILLAFGLFGSALAEPLKSGRNLRQEQVLLPADTPDRNRMATVDSFLLLEDGGAGIFIFYDDPRTDRVIDYIEFYDVAGHLLIVTWIDRFGVCYVAMDRGLLNAEEPAIDGTLVLVSVGQAV